MQEFLDDLWFWKRWSFVRLYCSTETGLMQSNTHEDTMQPRRRRERRRKWWEKTTTNKQKRAEWKSMLVFFSPLVNHLFHSECRPSAARNHQEPNFCRPPTICFFFLLRISQITFSVAKLKALDWWFSSQCAVPVPPGSSCHLMEKKIKLLFFFLNPLSASPSVRCH